MKQICLVIVSLCISFSSLAQIDVFDFKTVTLSAGYKSSHHEGMYVRRKGADLASVINPGANQSTIEVMADKGAALNVYGNYYQLDDNGIFTCSMEQFIYLLSYFGNMGSNNNGETGYSLRKQISTPSNNLKGVDNAVDFSEESRLWNFDFINTKMYFGKKNLSLGCSILMKQIGLAGPFTWFVDRKSEYIYVNTSSVYVLRTLVGPSVAYRKSFKNIAVVSFAGVNFSANLAKDAFKIGYNPFVDVNLFFGKNSHFTLGLKYELVRGTGTTNYQDKTAKKFDVKINQLDVKLGVYLGRTKS